MTFVIGVIVAMLLAVARQASAACVWGFEPSCDSGWSWWTWIASVVSGVWG